MSAGFHGEFCGDSVSRRTYCGESAFFDSSGEEVAHRSECFDLSVLGFVGSVCFTLHDSLEVVNFLQSSQISFPWVLMAGALQHVDLGQRGDFLRILKSERLSRSPLPTPEKRSIESGILGMT